MQEASISLTYTLICAGMPTALLVILAVLAYLIHEWRNTPTIPDPNPDHL